MTPNFLLQVWARKLFPFILFYSGFKILQLRSWRCRRVQYVVQIAVCINYIFFLGFLLYFCFCISFQCFIFVKGLAGTFVWHVYISYHSPDNSLSYIVKYNEHLVKSVLVTWMKFKTIYQYHVFIWLISSCSTFTDWILSLITS